MSSRDPVAVVISDIHIGDDAGIVRRQAAKGYSSTGTGLFVRDTFLEFQEKVATAAAGMPNKRIPYLILNGDGWPLSLSQP
jgi:hypothetical protein